MLNLILLGRCHVDPIEIVDPIKTEVSNPPAKKWWNKFFDKK